MDEVNAAITANAIILRGSPVTSADFRVTEEGAYIKGAILGRGMQFRVFECMKQMARASPNGSLRLRGPYFAWIWRYSPGVCRVIRRNVRQK